MPPPAPEECLVHARSGKYKGGTLVAEDVRELGAHLRRLADPCGYRPELCARCLHAILHVHSYPQRLLLGDGGGVPVVRIVQYICAHAECGATWRILPFFLARHLWRTWRTVERVVAPTETSTRHAPSIPSRTQRRWRARLASSARQLIVLLAVSGAVLLAAIAVAVALDATRSELVAAYARADAVAPTARLAALAALVHRLERGIRLM